MQCKAPLFELGTVDSVREKFAQRLPHPYRQIVNTYTRREAADGDTTNRRIVFPIAIHLWRWGEGKGHKQLGRS